MRVTIPSMQRAQQLGHPVTLDDMHPAGAHDFFRRVAAHRGWPEPTGTSLTPVLARLDAGRWLADCPLGCNGAEWVSQADPVFLCLSCGSGGQWWPVEFPAEKTGIDNEVTKRAAINAWGWNPGETLADLRAETGRLGR